MMTVGCAGFAVPATRYFKEYLFVEVQETHLATPGTGTLRRWRREAPKSFQFALLGPRQIGQEGFRAGKVIETALKDLSDVAEELAARTAVFVAPPDFPHTRANRAALKDFLNSVRPSFDAIVFEAGPAWDPDDADSIAEDTGIHERFGAHLTARARDAHPVEITNRFFPRQFRTDFNEKFRLQLSQPGIPPAHGAREVVFG